MSSQVTPEVNTAADLARLRDEGRPLSSQELKELNTRVKALEEMARLEDRLRALENRKRSRTATTPRSTAIEHQLER
jgi:single-stranded DNA-specific DHH superfamily exonuclease